MIAGGRAAEGSTAAGPVRRGPRDRARLALTFDDSPGPATEAIMDALARTEARATFFCVGAGADAGAAELRRAVAAGHELGNHSWSHADLSAPSAPVEAEIRRASAAIELAAGVAPRSFRAPYGRWSERLLDAVRRAGLRPVGWDVDSRDWEQASAASIVRRVLSAAHPGSIVLMHDGPGREATVAALERILTFFDEEGLGVVTVSEVLG